ncbi:MAG: gluconokinase, partial [Dermatophilaceae bacterium]
MSTAPPARPDRVVIGVDVGTTATKVVAFGLDSTWSHVSSRAYPVEHPSPGWHEQDPAQLLHAVLEGLGECVRAVGDAQVVGIGVSTAMHGLIGLDGAGAPLTPLVTWADTRAVDEVEALRESGQDRELHRATGTPVHPMSPLAKIMWFTRNEPELSAGVDAWVGLKTWIVRGLTGQLVCDLSSASDSGLLNRASGTWHQGALAWAGIDADRLPPIVPTTHSLPLHAQVAGASGLPPGTPVVVGAGDGPMGNLGTDAIRPGTVGVSIGTSAAARAVLPGPVLDLPRGLFCYALADDLWVVGGAASNGGSASRWVVDLLHQGDRDGDDETQALAAAGEVAPGSDGLYVVPYLRPERAPLWDVDIPGAVLGLRHHHTGAHLVRATVEGVAVQLAAVVEQIRILEEVTEIRATGGA